MKRASVLFSVFMLAALALLPPAAGQNVEVGKTTDNFTLPDTNGKSQSFNDLKGRNGTLVIFLSAQCPVVRSYVDRINQLAANYQAKGITFIGINSNSTESVEWVKLNAAEYNYKFPVLIDKGNVLADRLGATVTPEAYYFDAKNVLLYHGAIDNDRSGKAVSETYLKTAFDASLAGRPVAKAKANAFGCSIKRVGDK